MVRDVRRSFQCCVHGKLLLCGEHIALCGSGACGVLTEESLVLDFTEHGKGFACVSHVCGFDGVRIEVPVPFAFFAFVQELCKARGLPLLGHTIHGTIRLESSIPVGSGLGSSAALCCALARLMLHYTVRGGETPSVGYEHSVWSLAHAFEQFFHSKASGIDTALCAFGMPLVLLPNITNSAPLQHKAQCTMPFKVQLIAHHVVAGLHGIYGIIPREAPCAQTISMVQQNLQNDKRLVRALIYETEGVLKALCCETEHGLCAALSPYLLRIHEHLRSLGASTPRMEELLLYAQKHGACASKLSGGGAGGAFVCICPSEKVAQRVVRVLDTWLSAAFGDGVTMVRRFM